MPVPAVTVDSMRVPVPPLPCYLVEWYTPELTGDGLERIATTLDDSLAALCAQGTPVRLVSMLSVPTDETLFGVFVADSAPIVAHACQAAGVPAQRVTDAVDPRIGGTS